MNSILKKHTVFLATLIFCCGLASCKKKCGCEGANSFPVHFDLQETYEHAMVRIEVDGREVYHDTATTNHALGLALRTTDTLACGSHDLKVVVSNRDSGATSFSVKSEVFIGVSHDFQKGNVSFDVSEDAFNYE